MPPKADAGMRRLFACPLFYSHLVLLNFTLLHLRLSCLRGWTQANIPSSPVKLSYIRCRGETERKEEEDRDLSMFSPCRSFEVSTTSANMQCWDKIRTQNALYLLQKRKGCRFLSRCTLFQPPLASSHLAFPFLFDTLQK